MSTSNPLPVDQTNTTVADGGALPAKGVQVGGTDGSVFQVLSTDSAGRANVNINGTVDTELAAAGALADGAANPTTSVIGAFLQCFNGATWDRARGDTTNGIDVDVTRVSGTVTISGAVTNAGTFAVQDSEKVADNAGFTDGTTKVQPAGFVFDEVAGTALTENDAAAARIDSKRAQVTTLEDATTRGQRAAVSAAGRLSVDASGVAIPITDNAGSLTVDATAATFGINNSQVSGTAISVNSGVKDAGTQRVILASDQTVVPISDNSGSLTVDAPVGTPAFVRLSDGSAAITTLATSLASLPALATGSNLIGRVNIDPETSNGLSIFHLVSAATTNATNLKASAGQVYGWYIYNSNAAARKVAFHNTAGTPTAGASIVFAIVIPPTSAANVEYTTGIAFGTGIAITTVTDLTDAGATAVAANDLIINIFYK